MPTRSGKEYQLPAAEMASEMAAVAEVQQHEPALNHILSTSTSSSSNLSSLTPLPSDDVSQLHHLPGHLSLSTRTADDLVDQTLSVEGMLSGLSNSPETRVEENSLDCQEVEKALISSPSQRVEADLPREDDNPLREDDSTDKDAHSLALSSPSKRVKADLPREDDNPLREDDSTDKDAHSLALTFIEDAVPLDGDVGEHDGHETTVESSSRSMDIRSPVPSLGSTAMNPTEGVLSLHTYANVARGSESISATTSSVFTSWRSQPSFVTDTSSSSVPSREENNDNTDAFTLTQRAARPRPTQSPSMDVKRKFFDNWFITAASPAARSQRERTVSADGSPTRSSHAQSTTSLDDVVIPHVRIYEEWMSNFSPSITDHDSDGKENRTAVSHARRRHRRNMSHRVKKLNAKVRVNTVRATLKHSVENTSSGGRNTPESSAKKKGKGRQVEVHTSEEDERDDDARLAQIQADAWTAQKLQEELDRLYKKMDYRNKEPVAGPSSKRSGSRTTPVNQMDVPMAASSQLPPGSHLHRILKEDSQRQRESKKSHFDESSEDDDSESPSSSSSGYDWSSISSEPSDPDSNKSSRSRRRQRARKKNWKKKMLRIRLENTHAKPDPPFTYNGEPNFTLYQKWVLEAKDWLKHSFVQRKHRVSRLKKYLGGRAFLFFMRDVAHEPNKWTLARFLEGLFNYCFPTNFRSTQREKYYAFSQRGHPVRNYRRDLEELANSVRRISPRDFVICFWQGAEHYLHVKWAENGFDPEVSSIDDLEASADRYERASKLRQFETSRRDDTRSRHVDQRRDTRPVWNAHQQRDNRDGKDSKNAFRDRTTIRATPAKPDPKNCMAPHS